MRRPPFNLCLGADGRLLQISTPQITQALYVAGLAFVHEMRTSEFQLDSQASRQSGPSEAFLHLIDKQNLEVIVNALKKLESAWAGAGVMLYVLQKRAAGECA